MVQRFLSSETEIPITDFFLSGECTKPYYQIYRVLCNYLYDKDGQFSYVLYLKRRYFEMACEVLLSYAPTVHQNSDTATPPQLDSQRDK
jgi:hypothetical protein